MVEARLTVADRQTSTVAPRGGSQTNSSFSRSGLLNLRVFRDGSRYVIAAAGELDLSTAQVLEAELRKAESSDAERIVVDLSDLVFMDSAGPNLLLRAEARSRSDSNRLRVVAGPPRIQRVFELTKTDRVLPFL